MSMFKKAETKAVKLSLGILGPSGGGKTMSALRMARGIVGPTGRIAFIGTEGGKEQLYANRIEGGFENCTISAPYTLDKLNDAMNGAIEAGFDILVIDGLSPFWAGSGGALMQVDEIASVNSGNTSVGWNVVTKKIERLIEWIKNFPIHLIVTLRSEIKYELVQNAKGKMVPTKMGLQPIWRTGKQCITYDLDNVMDIAYNHKAKVTKTRLEGLADKIFDHPDENLGKQIATILESGNLLETPVDTRKPVDPDPIPTEEETVKLTEKERSLTKLEDLAIKTGRDAQTWFVQLAKHFGKDDIKDVPNTKLKEVIDKVTGDLAKAAK
jgi:hypothetical protein